MHLQLEISPDFGGGIRLKVEHVEMRRPARKIDIDDSLMRRTGPGLRLHAEELAQRETACGHSSYLEKVPPRISVTVRGLTIVFAKEFKHDTEG